MARLPTGSVPVSGIWCRTRRNNQSRRNSAKRRDQLELEIAQLRELKSSMDDSIDYRQLEWLLLEHAHLYEALDLLPPSP
jgi:hypothetical protein